MYNNIFYSEFKENLKSCKLNGVTKKQILDVNTINVTVRQQHLVVTIYIHVGYVMMKMKIMKQIDLVLLILYVHIATQNKIYIKTVNIVIQLLEVIFVIYAVSLIILQKNSIIVINVGFVELGIKQIIFIVTLVKHVYMSLL